MISPYVFGLAKSVKGLLLNLEAEKAGGKPDIAANLAEIRFLAQRIEHQRGLDHDDNMRKFLKRMINVENN